MAFAQGQLGKMTIIFYRKAGAPGVDGIVFNPMYNPSTFTINHSLEHEEKDLMNLGNINKKFIRMNPRKMSLDLFLDGTGASPSNLSGIGIDPSDISQINTVDLQVQTFLRLGYQIESEEHQPYYMMLIWGTFMMTAVMKSASVAYNLFDSTGRPLRAKMTLELEEFIDYDLRIKELKLKSSDVSKSITVVEGDTLSLLCFRQYGDASLYTKIAEVNKLTNYRKLKPGTQLLFPPLISIAQ